MCHLYADVTQFYFSSSPEQTEPNFLYSDETLEIQSIDSRQFSKLKLNLDKIEVPLVNESSVLHSCV